ncbi:T9SS C-terminal target domain-containing protein, partial [Cylindrospermopsis raciborskii CS-506_B]|nr:T9SS C-terminal target domain-containing protein [Cylindrospermopsis raciborskii CS-506_B]
MANTKGNDGDVSGLKGKTDIWVFKINQTGVLQWQRCLGGTNTDFGYSISESQDGGVVITGTTASNNGDVVGKLDENEF